MKMIDYSPNLKQFDRDEVDKNGQLYNILLDFKDNLFWSLKPRSHLYRIIRLNDFPTLILTPLATILFYNPVVIVGWLFLHNSLRRNYYLLS